MVRVLLACGVACILASFLGCGSSQAILINDLKQTGLAYHNYHDAHQKGPSGWDELIEFDKSAGGDGVSIARVRDAGYQMTWDVRFPELEAGMTNTVMAEKPGGGPKLMMDGSVR